MEIFVYIIFSLGMGVFAEVLNGRTIQFSRLAAFVPASVVWMTAADHYHLSCSVFYMIHMIVLSVFMYERKQFYRSVSCTCAAEILSIFAVLLCCLVTGHIHLPSIARFTFVSFLPHCAGVCAVQSVLYAAAVIKWYGREEMPAAVIGQNGPVVLSMVMLTLIFSLAIDIIARDVYVETRVPALIFVLSGLLITMLYSWQNMYQKALRLKQREMEAAALRNAASYNDELLAREKELARIRHDLKHYFHLLSEHPEIRDLQKEAEESDHGVYTDSAVLNYVLNIKKEDAREKQIDLHSSIHMADAIQMEEADLCLVVSNLLDNAIMHQGEEKEIYFELESTPHQLVIRTVNSCTAEPQKDQKEHGFGLETLNWIARKYKGSCVWEVNNSTFTCLFCIPQYSSR